MKIREITWVGPDAFRTGVVGGATVFKIADYSTGVSALWTELPGYGGSEQIIAKGDVGDLKKIAKEILEGFIGRMIEL